MSDTLSKDATELVREGRRALRPSDADKARILTAVQSRVAAGETTPRPDAAPTVTDGTGSALGLGKLAALTAGVLAAIAAVVVLTGGKRDIDEAQPVMPVGASVVAEATISAPADVTPPDVAVATAQPEVRVTPTPPQVTSANRANGSDRLAEEVALLTRAEKEFHSGNFKSALAVTDEHRQKFPKGTLVQERVNLRMQALCGMGRSDEAHSEAKRLERLAPSVATANVCPSTP